MSIMEVLEHLHISGASALLVLICCIAKLLDIIGTKALLMLSHKCIVGLLNLRAFLTLLRESLESSFQCKVSIPPNTLPIPVIAL